MDPSVSERKYKTGKKQLSELGLVSTIIRGRERSDQESVTHDLRVAFPAHSKSEWDTFIIPLAEVTA